MPKTILIADDSRLLREVYRQRLTQEHFRVLVAEGGREALRLLAAETPDLILLDLLMPEIDGYQVLESVKRQARLKPVPVIVLSGTSNPTELKRAFDLGASDFIMKATTPPENVVRQILHTLFPD